MAEVSTSENEPSVLPWFNGRTVDVVIYRINRRPLAQGNLFAEQPASFVDHLTETLLFGEPVKVGRRGERTWQLGNRIIDPADKYVAGVIGWESEHLQETDYFDDEAAAWVPSVGPASTVVLAPFVVEISSRQLFVLKHSSFAETTIATVFRTLLNQGEHARSDGATTEWDVQPLLDEVEFEEWLSQIAVLERVTFVAKLPNPDAEEAFRELDEHLKNMKASEMRHSLKAADETEGLSKDLGGDRLANGFLEMSKRGYASVSAVATDAQAKVRRFVQRNRAKREPVELTSADYNAARDELVERSLRSEE